MSEFSGKMKEYKQLSIDRFDGHNLKSTVFFLSHCHKDHMVGLDSSSFIEKLKSRTDVFLYCTEITKILLLSESAYKPLEKYIKVLIPKESESVSIPDPVSCTNSVIVVTPLPALHCPGSVMFVFEGDEGTVLYTGDFRWETNHAVNINAFKTGESLKQIESIYIDTTFCVESAFHFPSRSECCQVSCNIVRDWLLRSSQHYVHITSRTKYGHEPLMEELHASTGYKIHVLDWKYDVYSQISNLKNVFTTDPTTRIHACNKVAGKVCDSKLPCGFVSPDGQELHVRSVRPSTMFFTKGHNNLDSLYVPGHHLHRICYSFHSSYSEIRDIITYLKPKRIVPCVKPFPDNEIRQVQHRLNKFLKMPHRFNFTSPKNLLGKLKQRFQKPCIKKASTDSESLVFTVHSPAKEKNISLSESPCLKTPEIMEDDVENSQTRIEPSEVSSSYEPSLPRGEEMNLVESVDEENISEKQDDDNAEWLFCLYVSGDDEVDEDERMSTLTFTEGGEDNEDADLMEKRQSDIKEEVKQGEHETEINNVLKEKNSFRNNKDVNGCMVDEEKCEINVACLATKNSLGDGDLSSFSNKNENEDSYESHVNQMFSDSGKKTLQFPIVKTDDQVHSSNKPNKIKIDLILNSELSVCSEFLVSDTEQNQIVNPVVPKTFNHPTSEDEINFSDQIFENINSEKHVKKGHAESATDNSFQCSEKCNKRNRCKKSSSSDLFEENDDSSTDETHRPDAECMTGDKTGDSEGFSISLDGCEMQAESILKTNCSDILDNSCLRGAVQDKIKINNTNLYLQSKEFSHYSEVNLAASNFSLNVLPENESCLSKKRLSSPVGLLSISTNQQKSEEPINDDNIKTGDNVDENAEIDELKNGSDSDKCGYKITSSEGKTVCPPYLQETEFDDDVIVIDSEEPISKRRRKNSGNVSDSIFLNSVTSQNQKHSVVDHLDKLNNVLQIHSLQESDSDITLPPSQNSFNYIVADSGTGSDSDVLVISDDDEGDDSCYLDDTDQFMSAGWSNIRIGVNVFKVRADRFDDNEYIDLTDD